MDLLFEDDVGEKTMFEALKESGFKELFPGAYKLDLKAKDILSNKNGLQFDLFTRTVMGGLSLTPAMLRRAEKYAVFGMLTVYLAAKKKTSICSRPYNKTVST